MPTFFEQWLKQLSNDEAELMWNYFDGSYTNCEDVISVIAESHSEVKERICNG